MKNIIKKRDTYNYKNKNRHSLCFFRFYDADFQENKLHSKRYKRWQNNKRHHSYLSDSAGLYWFNYKYQHKW
jgi:hypothetical protein